MWMEEHQGSRINLNRIEEALASKPDTLCVSCPYCLTMFADGLKDLKADRTQVKDIAEVVAEGLRLDIVADKLSAGAAEKQVGMAQ